MRQELVAQELHTLRVSLNMLFDAEGEEALKECMKAAQTLRKMGIEVEVVPEVSYFMNPMIPALRGTRVYFDDELIFSGRAPKAEEIVEAVISILERGYVGGEEEILGVAAWSYNREFEDAASA